MQKCAQRATGSEGGSLADCAHYWQAFQECAAAHKVTIHSDAATNRLRFSTRMTWSEVPKYFDKAHGARFPEVTNIPSVVPALEKRS